jgi:hypothetical protein
VKRPRRSNARLRPATFAPKRIIAANPFSKVKARGAAVLVAITVKGSLKPQVYHPKIWHLRCISRDSGCSSRAGSSLCDASLH